MRIPNLNVSTNVTNTIRDLDQQRFKLDRQISTGQKITYPEEDGIKAGRLIQSDALKAKLAQYQRNASYASEFLNAGQLNLDNLQKLNQRAQEISRVAGSQINQSAAETYGHEIDQLVEEALNRINARHRGRSLFGGTEYKPNFGNTEVVVGLEDKKTISLNKSLVGSHELDGSRVMQASESLVFKLNGREYVVEVTRDGLTTEEALLIVRDLVNQDKGDLGQSPRFEDITSYRAYVRGGDGENSTRNDDANLRAEISNNGELIISGAANESYYASVDFFTQWNPNNYFPEQVDAKISAQTELLFPGKQFEELSESEKESIRRQVFQSGSSTFSASQFQLILDSNAVIKYRDEYSSRTPVGTPPLPPPLNGFADLDAVHQDEIFAKTYREFFNSGDLVFDLNDAQVAAITGQNGKAGFYSFDYYQNLNNPLYPMTGYLKPMEQNSDGVWGVSSDQTSTDLEITDLVNFYQLGTKSDQNVYEVDNSMVDDYVIDNQWIPVGAAPVMNWVREVAVDSNTLPGSSSFESIHSSTWKRLQTFTLGSVVEFDGRFWESKIANNTNHKPSSGSRFWSELPSEYSVEREDWTIESKEPSNRFYYISPDGHLFDDQIDAEEYTRGILMVSSNKLYNSDTDLTTDVNSLVRKITYPVANFLVQGSVSDAIATFDPKTLEYTLSAAKEGTDVIDAPYLKGQVEAYDGNNAPLDGSVFSYEGQYFLMLDSNNFDISAVENLDSINKQGGGAFLLGKELPQEGKETIFQEGRVDKISGRKGDFIFNVQSDGNGDPILPGTYYVALSDFFDEDSNSFQDVNKFREVPAWANRQGAEWSQSATYDFGQIVLHNGKYYQCQRDGFNNQVQLADTLQTVLTIKPDDETITDENGLEITNDIWSPLGESLDYVLKFKSKNENSPGVSIFPAGSSGTDAKAEAVVDSYGNVVGLKLLNPGRYFFGSSNQGVVPPNFENATISLNDGTSLTAKIIWEENPADPGPFRISGFELPDPYVDQNDPTINVFPSHNAQSNPLSGDTFSFATGSKTFLDHRDENGNLLGVTYLGGDKNATTRVGTSTDVSYMLDASNGNTKKLGDVVNSLVDLRDNLFDSADNPNANSIPETEKNLIALEDLIIDKMGELSATMVRMETSKAHDEDYVMALDKRISGDLEIDMSEAIMRLTRVSTAYQAAMQVGAQLLNNSLLNYL